MTYHGNKLAEIDTGYVHGVNAGRLTVYERGFGKWEVVWHPYRGAEVSLRVFSTKADAINYGWKVYGERMGYLPVAMASDSGV